MGARCAAKCVGIDWKHWGAVHHWRLDRDRDGVPPRVGHRRTVEHRHRYPYRLIAGHVGLRLVGLRLIGLLLKRVGLRRKRKHSAVGVMPRGDVHVVVLAGENLGVYGDLRAKQLHRRHTALQNLHRHCLVGQRRRHRDEGHVCLWGTTQLSVREGGQQLEYLVTKATREEY
jgi:hypothetical protein